MAAGSPRCPTLVSSTCCSRRGADRDVAAGDRDQRAGLPGGQLHRFAGRHHHRHPARQGEDRRDPAEARWWRPSRPATWSILAGFQGLSNELRDHDARPRRVGHDGGRDGGGARRRASARSTRTSPASSPPTPGSCPTPACSTHLATRRCWSSRPRARRCCSRGPWSTLGGTTSESTCGRRSATSRARGCRRRTRTDGRRLISGVALDTDEAKVTIDDVPDKPGVAASIFKAVAAEGINVDMIVQNVSHDGTHRPLVHGRRARTCRGWARARAARRATSAPSASRWTKASRSSRWSVPG